MLLRTKVACTVALVAGLGAGLAVVSWASTPDDHQDPTALAKAQLAAVRKVYDLKLEMLKRGEGKPFDTDRDYVWSRRWLDAERDASGKQHYDIAALEAHLSRMKQLEALVKQAYRAGEAGAAEVSGTEFYRLQAEFWLAQAKHAH